MNRPSRYERLHGKRPANKSTRIKRMKGRIAEREAKEGKE